MSPGPHPPYFCLDARDDLLDDGAMSAKEVDAYLAKLTPDKRATLEKIRKAIRAAAPKAEEGMSYGMPAFIQGKPIAGYAASATHCAYHPMSGAIVAALADELAGYETSKGTIRFPIGKPLTAKLVRRLVLARLAELTAAAPAKKAKAKASASPKNTKTPPRRVASGGDVVSFLRDLEHPLKKEIEAVRRILLGVSPAIGEGIKWNAPSFRTEKEYFATFHLRAKDRVHLVLHLGAKKRPDQRAFEVADPKGLLRWLGKDRALVTLGSGREIAANRAALEAIVRAWITHV
jgi:uncharacterized protein YdhG (YjbR/CyaY superfamily)